MVEVSCLLEECLMPRTRNKPEYNKRKLAELKLERQDIYKDWYCNSCGQIKPGSAMSNSQRSLCKDCACRRQWLRLLFDGSYKESQLVVSRNWYANNKENVYFQKIEHYYGLTKEKFEQNLIDQDYCCDLCGLPLGEDIVVDHDHSCCPVVKGAITSCGKCTRGLLHGRCNTLEGIFTDEMIEITRKYRRKWEQIVGKERPSESKNPYNTNSKYFLLFSKYGMYEEDFNRKLIEQNYCCDFCERELGDDIAVDHDTSCCNYGPNSNAIKTCGTCTRGLVHRKCNTIEGGYVEEMIENILKYRQRWTK